MSNTHGHPDSFGNEIFRGHKFCSSRFGCEVRTTSERENSWLIINNKLNIKLIVNRLLLTKHGSIQFYIDDYMKMLIFFKYTCWLAKTKVIIIVWNKIPINISSYKQ